MTLDELNVLAGDYLKEHVTPEHRVTIRELADHLKNANPAATCSTSTVAKLAAWRAYQTELERRGLKDRKQQTKAVALTDKVFATTGKVDPQLQRLIDEQKADEEPSPFEDDPPDGPPRRVHERKRL